MIVLDGVGLGQDNRDVHLLVRAHMPHLTDLLAERKLVLNGGPLDTGQATIFTGVSAAQELGFHWGPHLNEPLRQIISRRSIFRTLGKAGRRGAFANAHPERYLFGRPGWASSLTSCGTTEHSVSCILISASVVVTTAALERSQPARKQCRLHRGFSLGLWRDVQDKEAGIS